jgi:D-cysteine desulfhydrase family pyridoxal phosphate-dependent enzyme
MPDFPRVSLAHLPTPIEDMPRLRAALGGPRLLVKRDDATGLAFGGNKTRKLEYLAGEARLYRHDLLITAGAVQSNHCRQTAAAAAKLGMDCRLVLVGEPPEQPSANLLLDRLFNAGIVYAVPADRERVLEDTVEAARQEGRRPYLIPYGGSNPTGALGYAFAIREFMEQGVEADWIVFASSSGGTQAGMMAGARVYGCRTKLLGISVDEPQRILQERVAALAGETSRRLGARIRFLADEVSVNADYAAPGYGVLTGAEREAIRLFAHTEGLVIDPVYTGRAAAGMIDLIRKGFFRKNETVLFWHTGGTPALFAGKYAADLI